MYIPFDLWPRTRHTLYLFGIITATVLLITAATYGGGRDAPIPMEIRLALIAGAYVEILIGCIDLTRGATKRALIPLVFAAVLIDFSCRV